MNVPDPVTSLKQRVDQLAATVQSIATAMYAINSHPARRFLGGSQITGETAAIAARLDARANLAWAQFDELLRLNDEFAVLKNHEKPDASLQQSLTALLDGQSVILDADGVPVHHSGSPRATTLRLTDFADRLHTEATALLSQFTTVDNSCGTVADQAADINQQLQSAVERATTMGMQNNHELVALRERRDHDVALALNDPLTAAREGLLAPLTASLALFHTKMLNLQQIQQDYPTRLAALRQAVAALADAERQAAETCTLAAAKIANPPVPRIEPASGALSTRLLATEQLVADSSWHGLAERIDTLGTEIAQATSRCQDSAQAASALLERRMELRGRFSAYSRKAARIGVVEEPQVAHLLAETRELLKIAPCDLQAATRALYRFQKTISG